MSAMIGLLSSSVKTGQSEGRLACPMAYKGSLLAWLMEPARAPDDHVTQRADPNIC